MKQLITFSPQFNPINRTLDFSTYALFNVKKLYAVINITRNTPIYVAGAPGLGITVKNNSTITLMYDTSIHDTSDMLNVYYETTSGQEANVAMEQGGNLQDMREILNDIRMEIKVMSFILAAGLNIQRDDIMSLLTEEHNNISHF